MLTKNNVFAIKNNKIIITGNRNFNDGLWDIPLKSQAPPQKIPINPTTQPMTKQQSLNAIVSSRQTKYELMVPVCFLLFRTN